MIKRKYRDNGWAALFLLPSIVGLVLFMLVPIIGSLGLSFTEWNFTSGFKNIKWAGLANFAKLLQFKDPWFTTSFFNTLVFAVVTVPIGLILGIILGSVLDKSVYGSAIFRFVVFIPYIASTVASLTVWRVVFGPTFGPVNSMLMALGVENPPKWFVDAKWAFPLVMAFQIWQTLGYNTIVFYAGIKNIPSDLFEAATVDGANMWQKFRNVTLPMISPTTFFLSTMGVISAFKTFDVVKVATDGGPGRASSVIGLYIYREAFQNYRMGTASAAAWVMFIIIFGVTMFQLYGQRKWVTYD
jgi:multiple sugar transport system permease protein